MGAAVRNESFDGFIKANSRDLEVVDIFSLDFGCLN